MLANGQASIFDDAFYFDVKKNPFALARLIGQCTWYCWSKAHIKAKAYPERKLNVKNLPLRDADKWDDAAKANGYAVGKEPKADSIAVWDGKHVAYVEAVEGDNVCFSECNWNKSVNKSNTLNVPAAVYGLVCAKVKALAPGQNITIKKGGTDGAFKTMPRAAFEARKSGFVGYIYLN